MSDASDLIERAEQMAGCRWDDPDNPNALYALFGALAREMGRNPHGPRDDIAVGMHLAHAGARRASDEMLAALLMSGLDPRDIADMLGAK